MLTPQANTHTHTHIQITQACIFRDRQESNVAFHTNTDITDQRLIGLNLPLSLMKNHIALIACGTQRDFWVGCNQLNGNPTCLWLHLKRSVLHPTSIWTSLVWPGPAKDIPLVYVHQFHVIADEPTWKCLPQRLRWRKGRLWRDRHCHPCFSGARWWGHKGAEARLNVVFQLK